MIFLNDGRIWEMEFEEVMRGFEQLTGVKPKRLEDGYKFFVDNRFEVYCFRGPRQSWIIESCICSIPEDDFGKEEFLKKVLRTNLGRIPFHNEVLSIGEEEKLLLFRIVSPEDISSLEEIKKCFEEFFNSLEFWHKLTSKAEKIDSTPVREVIFFP